MGKWKNVGSYYFLYFPEFSALCKSEALISMGESNTVVSPYTLYRHLQKYSSYPSIWATYKLAFVIALNLGDANILLFGKE